MGLQLRMTAALRCKIAATLDRLTSERPSPLLYKLEEQRQVGSPNTVGPALAGVCRRSEGTEAQVIGLPAHPSLLRHSIRPPRALEWPHQASTRLHHRLGSQARPNSRRRAQRMRPVLPSLQHRRRIRPRHHSMGLRHHRLTVQLLQATHHRRRLSLVPPLLHPRTLRHHQLTALPLLLSRRAVVSRQPAPCTAQRRPAGLRHHLNSLRNPQNRIRYLQARPSTHQPLRTRIRLDRPNSLRDPVVLVLHLPIRNSPL